MHSWGDASLLLIGEAENNAENHNPVNTTVCTPGRRNTGRELVTHQRGWSSGEQRHHLLGIMGSSSKLSHKVVSAVIGCGARLSLLSLLFSSLDKVLFLHSEQKNP